MPNKSKSKVCICKITNNKLYLHKSSIGNKITTTTVNAKNINVDDKLTLKNSSGTIKGFALKNVDSTLNIGLNRVAVNSDGTEITNTQANMYDEFNYAPASPFIPTNFTYSNPTFIFGTQVLVCSQTITLSNNTWPYINKARILGIVGFCSMKLLTSKTITWTVKYSKNLGPEIEMAGGIYYTNSDSINVPINAITSDTFLAGDTIKIFLYGTYTGALPLPTITVPPVAFSAVYSAMLL